MSQDTHFRRPESVLVVVYTVAGEVLLLLRKQPLNFWQSVTGTLEWGESPAAAASRELCEETGIGNAEIVDRRFSQRFPILPNWRSRYAPDVEENLEHVFSAALPARVSVTLHPDEHTGLLWLPRDAAARKVWSWTNREAILSVVRTT